ncbi:DNA alkylation repair protein [Candidatus Leptofilum sp.]|uniref:DNA alkylation repair protein n=1 Tax=Candidatus Leptofilum sp. TaxID=3241576 RepID=UPI003B590DF1
MSGVKLSSQELIARLNSQNIKFGDVKKIAREIKRDHPLAMELWASEGFFPRLLSVLILDKKQLNQEIIESMAKDLQIHKPEERNRINEWLMANQLMKDKKLVTLMQTWEHHALPDLRRMFWYHQARLRWTGQNPPENTLNLVDAIEERLSDEVPEVQWAMNFTGGWIGVHDPQFRERMIAIGERHGLYKGIPVPQNCTPDYLPEFISIEVEKLKKKQ